MRPALTLALLRRGFRSAVREASLARCAALLVPMAALGACRTQPSPIEAKTEASTPSTATASGTATATTASTAPPATTANAPKGCEFGKYDVTGCGGAEVELKSSPAACGLPEAGNITKEQCAPFCKGFDYSSCSVSKARDNRGPRVFCHAAHPCMGRRPRRGHAPRNAGTASSFEAFLREAERTEARSVDAFVEVETALSTHGAPAALRNGCRRAAADEARHTTMMRGLMRTTAARRFPPRRARGFASLDALALHNEIEGVVSETWAALVAAYQAEHAEDPGVRRVFRTVAREELSHAALAHRISAWARTKLSARENAKLDRARAAALGRLEAGLPRIEAEGARALGWPPPDAERVLRARLGELLAHG